MNHLPQLLRAIAAAACVFAVGAARTSPSRDATTGAAAAQVRSIDARDVPAVGSRDGEAAPSGAAPGVVLAAAVGVVEPRRRPADREDARTRMAEVEELRRKVAALEEQMSRSRSEQELLQRLTEQLDAVRGDLAEREARGVAEGAAAQLALARRRQALDALSGAERQLATGDSQVLEILDGAVADLAFPAQRLVQHARSAVESKDLYQARYWLSLAIAQTQAALMRQ